MRKIALILVLIFWPLSNLCSQDIDKVFTVSKISTHSTSKDTIEKCNYSIAINFQDATTEIQSFTLEILSIIEVDRSTNPLVKDLLNQPIKASLNVKSGSISVLNFNDLEFEEKYGYIYGYDCGILSMEDRLHSFVNHELGFIKLLNAERFLSCEVYTDFTKYGQELFFTYESNVDDSTRAYYLERSLKEEFCYTFFDCLELDENKMLNADIRKTEDDYDDLELKTKRRISKKNYINAGIINLKEQSESRLQLYNVLLEKCLHDEDQVRLSVMASKSMDGKQKIILQRDHLSFPDSFNRQMKKTKDTFIVVAK